MLQRRTKCKIQNLRFSYSKNTANFEAFRLNISSSINLFFSEECCEVCTYFIHSWNWILLSFLINNIPRFLFLLISWMKLNRLSCMMWPNLLFFWYLIWRVFYLFIEFLFQLDGLRYAASSSFYGGGGCLHSSQSDNTRRESSISTDSGYLMSLPESRRDSAEVENFRENNMMYKNNGQQQHFKREEFLDTFNSQPKVGKVVGLMYKGDTKWPATMGQKIEKK